MKTSKRFSPALAILMVLTLVLSSLGLRSANVAAAPFLAPPSKPSAALMPALPQACTGTTCVLDAQTGTLTITGYPTPIPFWGFAPSLGGTPALPGPVLTVTQGDIVVVEVHNNLPASVGPISVVFGSQQDVEASTDGTNWVPVAIEFDGTTGAMVSMVQSAPTGGVVYYRFTATKPGTYLYKSGTDAGRQVTMGLFGALVVRPSANSLWAYDAVTAFNTEALLILSELDPDFNANPDQSLDLFKPKFQLINGLPFPDAGNIGVTDSQTVLLRYLNAGLMEHTLGTLGVNQTIIARDGNLLPFAAGAVVESIAPGETVDSLVTLPAGLTLGQLFPVYQANNMMHNNSAHDAATGKIVEFGGMLTFLEATAGGAPAGVGPLVTAIDITPIKTNGTSTVAVSATFSGAPTAAQYFIDSLATAIPATLNGNSMSFSIDAADLASAAWTSDEHTFYMQAQDANGWGPVGSAAFTLDKEGPESIALMLNPAVTNGLVDVALRATGNDREFGASDVVAATYTLNGVTLPMLGNEPVTKDVVSFTSTVPSATVNGLAEGSHTITVASQDQVQVGENNLGPDATISLTVDKTGPGTTLVTLSPAMVNFATKPEIASVRVTATVSDPISGGVNSAVAIAEGFIDTVMANGKGFKIFPADGLFDETTEAVYFDIPILEFSYMNVGMHNVYIHGRDAAGNWGTTAAGQVEVRRPGNDNQPPVIQNLVVTPQNVAPAAANTGVTYVLHAVVEDKASNIAQALWFADETVLFSDAYLLSPVDGAFDSPYEEMETVIDTSTWPNGTHTLMARVSDEAGNWTPVSSVSITVNNPESTTIVSENSTGDITGFSGTIGNVTFNPQADLDGNLLGMEAELSGANVPSIAFLDLPAGETALTASFLFNANNVLLSDQPVDIFVATNEEPVLGITVAPYTNNQAGYQLSAWVNDNGLTKTTGTFPIEPDRTYKLTLKWEAGVNKSITLLVDGKEWGVMNSLNTSAYRLHQLRLGPQTSVVENMSGRMYFDNFDAQRVLAAGPFWLYVPMIKR